MRSSRLVVAVLIGLAATVVVALTIRSTRNRQFRHEVASAREALENNRPGTARRLLLDLVSRRPGDPEALYLLGLAEEVLGRTDRAEALMEKVVQLDSLQAGLAALHLARRRQAEGDLTRAEALFQTALRHAGPHRPIARWDFARLLRLQGRMAEATQIYQQGISEHPEPAEGIRVLIKFETDSYPADFAREQLEQALRQKPGDQATLIGLANNAIRTGRLDEARRLLDLARNQNNLPTFWRSWLDWARNAGRPDEVTRALHELPVSNNTDDQALALSTKAWLAQQTGDLQEEKKALSDLDELTKGRPDVLDRLAQIALMEGQTERAESLRARRAEREKAWRAYLNAVRLPEPRARGDELARLAEAVGRTFDAAAWRALALPGDPSKELDQLIRRLLPPPDRTLASMVGEPPLSQAAKAPNPTEATGIVPRFEDAAAASGLASFVHDTGHLEGRLALPETGSGGVALLDFDGDGWLDVYAVQGGPFPPPVGQPCADRLFRNRRNGTFEDVSAQAGISTLPGGYGHGVAVGDFDNDGHPDLLITRWRSYLLLRNRGDGTFEDATASAGLTGDRDWPTSAAFADLDNDGDLDLYVCHYLAWDEFNDRTCIDPTRPGEYRCNPLDFPARSDHLFRNDGGRFIDVTSEIGALETQGRGLGVVAADLDSDGRVEYFVANDMSANYLWGQSNANSDLLEERALLAGVACNASGGYQAGMGVACGDLDADGRLDLLVTNYYGESTTFFRNLGDGYFADQSAPIGLAAPTRDRLGFGLVLLDVNNDGRLDLMSANGHVHDGRPEYPWKMRPQLLVGTSSGRLRDATAETGAPFSREVLGRGLASGDLDNDGRVDAVLVAQGEPLLHLRNVTEASGHFLTLRLVGTKSNRDAVGATVLVEAGGRTLVSCRSGGGSYQSSSDPRLHFGLGQATRVDRVEVRWPSGHTDRLENLAVDQIHTLQEGQPNPINPMPPGSSAG